MELDIRVQGGWSMKGGSTRAKTMEEGVANGDGMGGEWKHQGEGINMFVQLPKK